MGRWVEAVLGAKKVQGINCALLQKAREPTLLQWGGDRTDFGRGLKVLDPAKSMASLRRGRAEVISLPSAAESEAPPPSGDIPSEERGWAGGDQVQTLLGNACLPQA